jgi:hypothetical protein
MLVSEANRQKLYYLRVCVIAAKFTESWSEGWLVHTADKSLVQDHSFSVHAVPGWLRTCQKVVFSGTSDDLIDARRIRNSNNTFV